MKQRANEIKTEKKKKIENFQRKRAKERSEQRAESDERKRQVNEEYDVLLVSIL